MADFVAILNKTIEGLGDRNSQDMRQKVYERARKAVTDKLAAITPPPTAAQSERQFKLLDAAIETIEASYAPPPLKEVPAPQIKPVSSDPLADFLASVEAEDAKLGITPAPAKPVTPTFTQAPSVIPTPANMPRVSMDVTDPVLGLDGPEQLSIPGSDLPRRPAKKRGLSGLLFGLLGVLFIGGAGYAGYFYQDQIQSFLGTSMEKVAAPQTPAANVEAEKPADVAIAEPVQPPAVEPATTEPAAADPAIAEPAGPIEQTETPKLTQRLNADGTEVDAGPGAKPADVGEGATVAAATTPSTAAPAVETPAAPAVDGETPAVPAADGEVTGVPAVNGQTPPAAPAQTIAVGQKAIFYEEKTGTEQGTADQGAVVWSVIQDSPGLDQPPEPAIRGEVNVPDKGIKVRLTIKRNLDKSLPASHIIEMLFTTPPDFAGGPIADVQRFAMKDTEQAPGNPLVGVPASFGDGFFLIALTDEKSAIDTNISLLGKQQWIDVPVAYGSGRRALLSFEKGLTGERVFEEVLKSWAAKAAGAG
jgi:hypothetical protein